MKCLVVQPAFEQFKCLPQIIILIPLPFQRFQICYLSFQSSFHLSFTVLVRYRSPINIQLQKKFISKLGQQSQTTRLFVFDRTILPNRLRGYHPFQRGFPTDLCLRLTSDRNSRLQLFTLGKDFQSELLPFHSPLLGQSLLVSFPLLTDMLKFSRYSCLISGTKYSFSDQIKPSSTKILDHNLCDH